MLLLVVSSLSKEVTLVSLVSLIFDDLSKDSLTDLAVLSVLMSSSK